MSSSWLTPIVILGRMPAIRMAIFGIACDGAAAAAFAPYLSIFAVDQVGLNPVIYSAVVFLQATVGVLVSVAVGFFSDRARSRKALLVAVTFAAIFGYIAISRVSSSIALVAVLVLVFPLGASITNQCFAVVRAELTRLPAEERTVPNSIARSCVSFVWIIVPPVTALVLLNGVPLSFIFVWAAAITAVYLVFLLYTPMRAEGPANDQAKDTAFPLLQILRPFTLARLLSIAALEAVVRLHLLFFGLMLVNVLGGTVAYVGIAQGLMAGMEIPFMVAWAFVARRIGLSMTLVAAAGAEIIYMLLLPHVGSARGVMFILPFHALGVSAILSISITYVQDLVEGLPGLGSSLMSVVGLISTAIAAAGFAVATALWGYSGAAFISAALAFAGGAGIWLCAKWPSGETARETAKAE